MVREVADEKLYAVDHRAHIIIGLHIVRAGYFRYVFTAMQQQLGLKLESVKAPVEVLVISHVEKPSAN